nr:hypothetical protein [Streptomyces sp. 846.5]
MAAVLLVIAALAPVPAVAAEHRYRAVGHRMAVVFDAPYTDASNWTLGHTSAYPPPDTHHRQCNRANGKLDCISPAWSAPTGSTFTAHRTSSGCWQADEASTEYSPGHFQVQTGDEVRARVTLNADSGAWASLWTWPQEVDLFEYHAAHPTRLELANHANPTGYRPKGSYRLYDHLISPGTAFTLDVRLLATGVQWRVNDRLVFTSVALPTTWKSYLIVNLSIDSGTRAPTKHATRAAFTLAHLTVLRPI